MHSAAKVVPLAVFCFLFVEFGHEAFALKCYQGVDTNITEVDAADDEVCYFRPEHACDKTSPANFDVNTTTQAGDHCDPVALECYCSAHDGCNADFQYLQEKWQEAENASESDHASTPEETARFQCMKDFLQHKEQQVGASINKNGGSDSTTVGGQDPDSTGTGAQGTQDPDSAGTGTQGAQDPDSAGTGTQGSQDQDSAGTGTQGTPDPDSTNAGSQGAGSVTSSEPGQGSGDRHKADASREQGRKAGAGKDSFWLLFTILAVIAGILIIVAIILFVVATAQHGKMKAR
ncbi:hypothetical protein Q1695_015367 [Nippostrongylus brasiliensis]|nr:hypothetical protein Q1695_015367 [Nippostrongylus brasiliensis]